MANDDYYTLVAKILVHLYKKYKQKDIEKDYIYPLTKDFPVKEEQLMETISMMIEQGLIKGTCTKAWGGIVMIDYNSLKITSAGIDYLQDNSKIRKICETLIEAKSIWELFM